MISKNLIKINVDVKNKKEAINYLANMAYQEMKVSDTNSFIDAVLEREVAISTNVGLGVAIPHGKSDAVREAFITMIRPKKPIVWDDDTDSVSLIFMIGVSNSNEKLHLIYISKISKLLMHEEFREKLINAKDESEIYQLFIEGE